MLDTKSLLDPCQLDPAKPVLVGVSGGPDSLCLLHILHTAGYRVIVAHFNHQLRPEADLEAGSVSELARRLGLPFTSASHNVRLHADSHGLSLEEAARLLRYKFLFEAARQAAAQAVAVGHTADDQVETVLMHFLRGAGLSGLKGMEQRLILPVFDASIPLVRPLLSLWRVDTEAYCREHALQPHIDSSNADQTYFRNRLRHALLPELEKYNPGIKNSLLHTTRALQGDYAVLQEIIEDVWKKVVLESGDGWVAFDQPGLVGLSPGLQRNLVRRAAEILRPESRDIGFAALQRAVAFIQSPLGRQVDLINGLYLFHEMGKIVLAAYEADLNFQQWPQVEQPITVQTLPSQGSHLHLALNDGWVLTGEELDRIAGNGTPESDNWSSWLDAGQIPSGSLILRARRAGDAFSPLGMGQQSISLKDFFMNVKIPRRARSQWPLVCAGEQIVWVVGYRIAHPFRLTENTRRILHLEMKKLPQA